MGISPTENARLFTAHKGICSTVKSDADDSEYTIVAVGGSAKYREDSQGQLYADGFGDMFAAPYALMGHPLRQIMLDAGTSVVDAQPSEFNGGSLVTVTIHTAGTRIGKTAKVTLDPSREWLIREAVIAPTNAFMGDATVTVEYIEKPGMPPVPKVVSIAEKPSLRRCEFNEFQLATTPEVEFSLPFYGLPDINARHTGRSRAPLWLFLVAAALIAGSIGLKRWANYIR